MTPTVSPPALRRRSNNAWLVVVLVALATFATARSAEATHFAYGTLYWEIDQTYVDPFNFRVRVTMEGAFRWSFPWGPANPPIGTIVFPGALLYTPTGGPSGFVNVPITVLVINAAEDWFIGAGTVLLTFPKNQAPVSISFENCCRLSDLREGNNDANFFLRTVIPYGPGQPLRSPRSTSLPRIYAQVNTPLMFQLPSQAPAGFANRFSLAPTPSSGLPAPRPMGFLACNTAACSTSCYGNNAGVCAGGMNVSATGLITWTPQLTGHYAVQFGITAIDQNQVAYATVPLDILIDVETACNPSLPGCNTPPYFDPVPPGTVQALTGDPVTFTFGLDDVNTGQTVSLVTSALPPGSSISPAPATSNTPGTTYTFSWPAATPGDHLVCFQGLDSVGDASFGQPCTTIQVRNNAAPTAGCSAAQVLDATSQAGTSATVSVMAADPDQQALTVSWTLNLTPDGTSNIPAGAGGTASITRTLAAGVHTFTAQVSDGQLSTSCTTTVDVRKIAQTITFNSVGPFTYGHAAVALTATASSNLPVTIEVLSGPGTLAGNMLSLTGAGLIEVKATQTGDGLYKPADPVMVMVTVDRAPLDVVAQNAFKTEGQPNPAFAVSYLTFVNSDTAASLGGTLSFTTAATVSSPPGPYAVVPGGLSSTNYTIRFVPGTLYVGVCLTVEDLKPATRGSTIPVKIRPCGTAGTVTLRAIAVQDAAGNPLPAQDAGNANSDGFFRDAAAFMFNLQTTGLVPGSYTLLYEVVGEPVARAVPFIVQ